MPEVTEVKPLRRKSHELDGARPRTGAKVFDVPVVVTTEEDGRRRVMSAYKGRRKVKDVVPRPTEKPAAIQTSLEKDFLELFH